MAPQETTAKQKKQPDETPQSNLLQKQSIDVIIPTGPDEYEIRKTLPLSLVLPRSLFPIGDRPMLWHVLRQLSCLKDSINKVYLLVKRVKGVATWRWLKNYNTVYNFSDVDQEFIRKIEDPIVSSSSLTRQIVEVLSRSKAEFILYHLPDIIFPLKGVHKTHLHNSFKDLLESHTQSFKNNNKVIGTLWGSHQQHFPVGLIEHKDNNVIRLYEKEFGTEPLSQIGSSTPHISVNIGISIFSKDQLKEALKNKSSNDLYKVVEEIISAQRLTIPEDCPQSPFKYCYYTGKWFHVDNLSDLQRINSEYERRLFSH